MMKLSISVARDIIKNLKKIEQTIVEGNMGGYNPRNDAFTKLNVELEMYHELLDNVYQHRDEYMDVVYNDYIWMSHKERQDFLGNEANGYSMAAFSIQKYMMLIGDLIFTDDVDVFKTLYQEMHNAFYEYDLKIKNR